MKRTSTATAQRSENTAPIEGMRVGRIVRLDESGHALVDYPGNGLGPVVARTTTASNAKLSQAGSPVGREVLLAFDNSDPRFPIIIDTMYSLIEEMVEPAVTAVEAEKPLSAHIDGKRICFDAEQEIVLRCGKASITLTRTGKILIKGEYVLSHSSGENRLRGGSVSIN